jgi:hypothetical protein
MRIEIRSLDDEYPAVLGWLSDTPEGVLVEAARPAPDPELSAEEPGWEQEGALCDMVRLRRVVRYARGDLFTRGPLPGRLWAEVVPDQGDYDVIARDVVPEGGPWGPWTPCVVVTVPRRVGLDGGGAVPDKDKAAGRVLTTPRPA